MLSHKRASKARYPSASSKQELMCMKIWTGAIGLVSHLQRVYLQRKYRAIGNAIGYLCSPYVQELLLLSTAPDHIDGFHASLLCKCYDHAA